MSCVFALKCAILLCMGLSRGLQQWPLFYIVWTVFFFSFLSKKACVFSVSSVIIQNILQTCVASSLSPGKGRGDSVWAGGSLLTNLLWRLINQNFYCSFIVLTYCSHCLTYVCFQITKFVQDRHRARRNRLRKDQLKKLPVHKFKKGKWIILCWTN